jgi:pimeloyl-ACP methyl ester carboxylesterase
MSTPVVLVHGLGGSPASWDRVVPLLAPHAGPIIAPALTGEESIGAEADRIARLLAHRGGPPAVVAGHSMGGLVATALAERAPQWVGRLVLLNSPPTSQSRISARGAGERLLALPLLGPLAWHLMPRAVAAKGLAGAFAPGTTVPEVFVDDLRNTGLPAFLRSSRAIDTYLDTQTLPARLAALACPIHVVFGMQDQRVDPASVDDYRRVPAVTVTTLPDAGHSPNWEQPAAAASAILAQSPFTPSP